MWGNNSVDQIREASGLVYNIYIYIYSICGQHAVSFFLNSSAQHRENEAEPDSNNNIIYIYYIYLSLSYY